MRSLEIDQTYSFGVLGSVDRYLPRLHVTFSRLVSGGHLYSKLTVGWTWNI